jgi:hypothetical protein
MSSLVKVFKGCAFVLAVLGIDDSNRAAAAHTKTAQCKHAANSAQGMFTVAFC